MTSSKKEKEKKLTVGDYLTLQKVKKLLNVTPSNIDMLQAIIQERQRIWDEIISDPVLFNKNISKSNNPSGVSETKLKKIIFGEEKER